MASKPFVTHSLQHNGAWNFAWYYASHVVYAVLDDFRGLELPRTRTRTRTRTWASRTRTRTWKLVLEDPRGQGLSSRTTTLEPCKLNEYDSGHSPTDELNHLSIVVCLQLSSCMHNDHATTSLLWSALQSASYNWLSACSALNAATQLT